MRLGKVFIASIVLMLAMGISRPQTEACTGIRLIADDGSVVYGRTMEWGTFDLHSRVAIIPRGYEFQGTTPEGKNGKKWMSKYGVTGLDMLHKDLIADGMNEKGLAVGLFYHPGFAEYGEYDPAHAGNTITAVDITSYILTQYASVDEVREGMTDVNVVGVVEEAIGIIVQGHWMVTDASGESIVIEYLEGELRIFDNPLGVITNAPEYHWHMTNLRNYINLSAVALPTLHIEELDFAPLGGGSGMIGLPGDFTPPSRFVRAVAWTQTARPLPDSAEAVYELFRILDSFNVPLGAAEGSDADATNLEDMRSSTIWTSGWDLAQKTLYVHTQHNRRVRKVQVNAVDFSGEEIVHVVLDEKKEQDYLDITP